MEDLQIDKIGLDRLGIEKRSTVRRKHGYNWEWVWSSTSGTHSWQIIRGPRGQDFPTMNGTKFPNVKLERLLVHVLYCGRALVVSSESLHSAAVPKSVRPPAICLIICFIFKHGCAQVMLKWKGYHEEVVVHNPWAVRTASDFVIYLVFAMRCLEILFMRHVSQRRSLKYLSKFITLTGENLCSYPTHTVGGWVQVQIWYGNEDFFGWWGPHLVFRVCDLDNFLVWPCNLEDKDMILAR